MVAFRLKDSGEGLSSSSFFQLSIFVVFDTVNDLINNLNHLQRNSKPDDSVCSLFLGSKISIYFLISGNLYHPMSSQIKPHMGMA